MSNILQEDNMNRMAAIMSAFGRMEKTLKSIDDNLAIIAVTLEETKSHLSDVDFAQICCGDIIENTYEIVKAALTDPNPNQASGSDDHVEVDHVSDTDSD